MNYYQHISGAFHRTIETVSLSVDTLAPGLEYACDLISHALISDNKILCCGNGPGAAVCALLSHHFCHQYAQERPALPLLNLCADATVISALANSEQAQQLYARPLQALGLPGDILVVVVGNEDQASLSKALQTAKERELRVVLMSGARQSELPSWLDQHDVHLATVADNVARITELQIMAVNCLSELIDNKLFGTYLSEQEMLLP